MFRNMNPVHIHTHTHTSLSEGFECSTELHFADRETEACGSV